MKRIPKVLLLGGDPHNYHPLGKVSDIFFDYSKKLEFDLTITTDRRYLYLKKIKNFDLIISYTTEGKMDKKQSQALKEAITGNPWGKIGRPINFIAIHGALASFLNSEWYFKMLGGKFLVHPPATRFTVNVVDKNNPITQDVSDFEINDELYLMEFYPPFHTLLSTKYGEFEIPVAWVKNYGMGKIFSISLGHFREVFLHPEVNKILYNAIKWSLYPL